MCALEYRNALKNDKTGEFTSLKRTFVSNC